MTPAEAGSLVTPGLATGLAYTLVTVFGMVIGSFLNVVIWRVPRGESIVSPPSACPLCGHVIRRRDNVPVLSWLILRGRCRDCRGPIAARYPLVEVGTGALFALVVFRFGLDTPGVWAVPAFLYLAAVSVALALIDIDVHRLPDTIVLPAYPVLASLLIVASWGGGAMSALVRAGIGMAALFVMYFVLMLVYPAGMGFGDVKLAGVLGMALGWLGWGALIVGGFAAFLVGGGYAVGLLVSGRAHRRSGIPFGPWMVVGAAIGVGWGLQVWTAYLSVIT